jgi:prophage regulatory protein
MPIKILRLSAVKERTGLSRSSIYLQISKGTFPSPISLGARAVGWIESEIDEWFQRRILMGRQGTLLSAQKRHTTVPS